MQVPLNERQKPDYRFANIYPHVDVFLQGGWYCRVVVEMEGFAAM